MTDPRSYAVRGTYDAARAALNAMMAADGPLGSSAVAISGGTATAPVGSGTRAAERAQVAWGSAVELLRALIGRTDLSGQAVIAEARRQQRLSLNDAHALAALQSWVERTSGTTGSVEVSGESERGVARDALLALDHAMESIGAGAMPNPAAASGAAAYIDSMTALGSAARAQQRATQEPPGGEMASPRRMRWNISRTMLLALGAAVLVIALAVAGWFAFGNSRTESLYRDAVTAYQRGNREAARVAFARVAQDNPDDPRALIFLGRIAREDGDLARSRRFLEAAVRADGRSALAQREFGATMLVDGQPEIARRFYVRAIELDPTDRTAQGFLGCTLLRLNRFEEARRWFDRAGPGDWMRCASTMPMPYPGAAYPGAPSPYPPQYPPQQPAYPPPVVR